jgi:hypothetical protein
MFALRFFGTFIPFYLTLKGTNKLGSWTLTSNPYTVLSVVLKTGGSAWSTAVVHAVFTETDQSTAA